MLLTSSHRPPRSTLFPYTTLFRSEREPEVNRFIQKIENEVVRNRFINLSSLLQNVYHSLVRYLRSEEHTSELQSRGHLVCRLLLEKKNIPELIDLVHELDQHDTRA